MKKYYMAAAHNVVRALDAGNIRFPIGKEELLAQVGNREVQIDFDRKISISEYCGNIKIDNFENKAQFFSALTAANTEEV
ncbi:MAG: hypothetical protein LBP30_06030 [Clostridiales Family XIII bacterium]|jgi:hypothetical protein|nr:hypothetical protein [Clostridiales Family XIII bacterium]